MANSVAWDPCSSVGRPGKHEGGWESANKQICIPNETFGKWRCLKTEL